MSDVSVVIVTHNALPWIEQSLESVRGVDTVVVDNGSSDGTVAFVRERFQALGFARVDVDSRGYRRGSLLAERASPERA